MGLGADVDARSPFDGFEQKMAGSSFTSETETAPFRATVNFFLPSAELRKVSTLPLLDLRTAFDAIDHQILHPRLGIILASVPLVSIMSGGLKSGGRSCKQLLFVRSSPLLLGAPRVSVLGPSLFALYATLLQSWPLSLRAHITASHSGNHRPFAGTTTKKKAQMTYII